MELHLRLDILKKYNLDTDEFLVLEAQRESEKFLWPEKLAELCGVPLEKAQSACKKISEIMMLSKL